MCQVDDISMQQAKLRNRLLFLITEKERREQRRITQIEVARAVNATAHTIGSWVRNDVTKFEGPLIERLCAYFECEVGDLLYLDRSKAE